MAPVAGTMLVACTYTGRLSSSGRVKLCDDGLKLRSRVLAWFRLRDQVRSTLALKRLPRIGPFQLTFDRTLRGAAKSRAKSVAFGASLAKTLPVLPSAQRDGIVEGSAA